MAQELRILILEDVPTDAALAERELRAAGFTFVSRRVQTETAFVGQLTGFHPDLILADFALPSFDGITALRLTREVDPELPFIMLSATMGEEQAIDSLHRGATDYVLKQRLSRLVPAVQRALNEAVERRERRCAEAELRNSEKRFRALIENSSDGILLLDRSGVVLYLSASGERITGYSAHDLVGQRLTTLVHPDDMAELAQPVSQLTRGHGQSRVLCGRVRCPGGEWRWMEGVYHNLLREPGVHAIVVNFRDVTEHRRVEQEQQKLIALIESSPDFIAVASLDGQVQYVNRGGRALMGLSDADISNLHVSQFVSPSRSAQLNAVLDSVRSEGRWQGEGTLRHFQTERVIPTEMQVFTIPNSQTHKPMAIGTVMQDVTARQQAEEAVRESERKLRSIVEQSQDGIVLTDERGLIIEWNTAEARIAGRPKDQAIGRPIWDVQFQAFPKEARTPEAYERLKEVTLSLYRTGQATQLGQLTERQIESAGALLTVQEIAFAIPTERGFMVASISRDVTVQKQAEKALRQSEEKYRNIFENAVEGIYQSSPQGRFISINSSMAHMFGYASPEQMMASITNIEDQFFADPGHRAAFIQQVEETGKIENAETECLRQDGSRIWISANARAVTDTDGNLLHYEGFFHDITARRRSEEELQRRAAHQAALNEVIGAANQAGAKVEALLEIGLAQVLRALGLERGTAWLALVDGTEQPVVARGLSVAVATSLAQMSGAGKSKLDQVVAVEDEASASGPLAEALRPADLHAWIVSPLTAEGKPIGGLAIGSPELHHWSYEDVALVIAVSRQLGAAVERARMFEQTQRRAQQLALLYDAGLALNSVLDSKVQLEFLFKTAMEAVHAGCAEFLRYDPASDEIRLETAVGCSENHVRGARERPPLRLAQDDALVCQVARSRTPVNVPDLAAAPNEAVVDPEIRSGLWLPVVHGNMLMGVLAMFSVRPNAFTVHDEQLLALFANQAAVAMENARLFEAEQLGRKELTALYGVSRAMADTDDLATALNLTVRRAVETIRVTFARIALVEGNDWVVQDVFPIRALDRDLKTGDRGTLAANGPCQRTIESNESILVTRDDPELTPLDREKLFLDVAQTVCLIPLRVDEQKLGLLMLGEARSHDREPFTDDKVRMARSIADAAASAIRRVGLREEIEKRLRQVQALHEIDTAITSSTDLGVSLHIVLGHVVEQLDIDAAAVLLFDPLTGTLDFAAGRGFGTSIIEESRLHLGEGMAGRVALERQTIRLEQIVRTGNVPKRSRLIVKEGFVTYYGVPLVAKGKLKGVLEIFHRKPFEGDAEWMHLLETLATHTTIAIDNAQLLAHLEQSNTELQLAYDSTIEGWSRALDLRDKETEGHTQRVTEVAVQLGRQTGIGESELVHLRRGALLHDIGKMGIPDHILLKKGALTEEEWTLMRQHPTLANGLLSSIAYLRPALDIPYCHHEKWDGTGYPRGLKGDRIPLMARVFAVVDVWDALRSERPYREAWPENKVRAHLLECSGKHFDPNVVEAFLTLLGSIAPESESGVDPKSRTTGYSARVFKI